MLRVFTALVLLVVVLSFASAAPPKPSSGKRTPKVPKSDDDEDNSPAAQEEKYRDVIKCGSCETMVKALAERARTSPLGELAPPGQKKKTLANREKATRHARALEYIDGACDKESGRERIYCDQNRERFEDELVDLVVNDGVHPKFEKAEDICLPVCEYKTSMKTQITDMQEEIKRKYKKTLVTEVLELLRDYWYCWLGMFLSILGIGLFMQMKLLRRAQLQRRKQK